MTISDTSPVVRDRCPRRSRGARLRRPLGRRSSTSRSPPGRPPPRHPRLARSPPSSRWRCSAGSRPFVRPRAGRRRGSTPTTPTCRRRGCGTGSTAPTSASMTPGDTPTNMTLTITVAGGSFGSATPGYGVASVLTRLRHHRRPLRRPDVEPGGHRQQRRHQLRHPHRCWRSPPPSADVLVLSELMSNNDARTWSSGNPPSGWSVFGHVMEASLSRVTGRGRPSPVQGLGWCRHRSGDRHPRGDHALAHADVRHQGPSPSRPQTWTGSAGTSAWRGHRAFAHHRRVAPGRARWHGSGSAGGGRRLRGTGTAVWVRSTPCRDRRSILDLVSAGQASWVARGTSVAPQRRVPSPSSARCRPPSPWLSPVTKTDGQVNDDAHRHRHAGAAGVASSPR